MKQKKKKIALVITIWLVVIVLASCALSAALTYIALSKRIDRQTRTLVRQHVKNVSTDIEEIIVPVVEARLHKMMENLTPDADRPVVYRAFYTF